MISGVIGINYKHKNLSYKNRGKSFEKLIEYTNRQYKLKGLALIDQVPTPTKNIKGRIVYEKKSTVDFIGISKSKAIAFDAKNTKQETRFDLKNVHVHQVEYLKHHQEQGGKAFFLIHFEKLQKTFFVPLGWFLRYWEGAKLGGRKSIPIEDIQFHCEEVRSENGIALHYLKYCS